jgi:predicted nucleotidyltransferase
LCRATHGGQAVLTVGITFADPNSDPSWPDAGQLQSIVQLVNSVFGSDVLGAYLHGSAVLGGLRPTSDVDVLVVLERPMTATQRRTLVEGLLDVSGARAHHGSARPVELSVVVESDVRPWRYPPRQEFLYGEWLRDTYELSGAPQPEPAPDLSILITMVLQGNAVLVGPPPAQLLDLVPQDDLLRGAVAGIPHLLGDLESDTRNVVLTLARIWTTLETGQIHSKDAAAAWALNRLPPEHQPVLDRARAMYVDGVDEEQWHDLPAVRAHAEYVVQAIRQSARS